MSLVPRGSAASRSVERQMEALGEVADRRVAGVDQLAAELGHLAVREVAAAVGVHAPADPVGGLVDGRADPLVLQAERGREPGDAAAHDRDPGAVPARRAGRPGERRRAAEHDRRADEAAALDELPARQRPFGLPLAELGGPDPQGLGLTVLPGQALQRTHQRCPCHGSPLLSLLLQKE